MKQVSAETKEIWQSGDYVGVDRRPIHRAVIQRFRMQHVDYRVLRDHTREWAHDGKFSSGLFGSKSRPRELHNIKSIKWSRGVDTDVATCTIVLYNVHGDHDLTPTEGEFDFPGWFTPNRGTEDFFDRWNYQSNKWEDWLLPDRLIRTFEGYGFDVDQIPEKDPHMHPSGVWLIDDVTFTTDGLITIECRDFGRVLLDHIMFPPVVPWKAYPLTWSKFETKTGRPKAVPDGGDWELAKFQKSSDEYYIGSGLTDDGRPLVDGNGTVYRHHARDAFDGDDTTYWLSAGCKRPETRSAYAWIQGHFAAQKVQGIKLDPRGQDYRMFVSLQNSDGKWLGRNEIPYIANDEIDIEADIPFVESFKVEKAYIDTFKLKRQYDDIVRIRLTFTDLNDLGVGEKYKFRVGVQDFRFANKAKEISDPASYKLGNYGDYTEIVKWLCAWAGFYWPRAGSGRAFQTLSDGSRDTIAPASSDPVIRKGRVWGDFENTGTAGVAKFDVDVWDKKPVMDGIAVVRDITGFEFWIDETGGVIWRLANVWKKGNYLMPVEGGPRTKRTDEIVTIDERTTLIDLSSKLSSRNVRERVFIGNITGKFGSVVKGYNPAPSGMRRVGGWTDQRFKDDTECQIMADMIALRQSFLYRQNTITIAANPAIQVDDQVMIYERLSGEGYLHRVLAITSDFDNESGKWTYTLTTHWLGDEAFTKKAWSAERLSDATQQYLRSLGKIA